MSSVLDRPSVESPSSPEENPYLFSVDQFYRIIELGIFPRERRVGLWEGMLYEKMAKTQSHAVAGINVTMTLARVLPQGWCLSSENPIAIGPRSAPLPDMVVLRGVGNDYLDRRPGPADVGLVVEFSLTSLKEDTGPKLAAYASAGIPSYWVLNLVEGVVHVYSEPIPAESRFASEATARRGESIPLTLDGVVACQVAASDLLPAR
jgi:Uma2 family endonuclease